MNNPDTCKMVELNGVKIPILPDVFSPTIIAALERGSYEQAEARALPKILREGERVLEIGAGIGYLSTIMARDHRSSAVRVYEANPLLLPIIAEVHRLNDVADVDVRHGVLNSRAADGTSTFYVRGDFWGSSLQKEPWGYDYTIEVPNISFAEEIASYRPTLIVCDIEGGELDLFRTARLDTVQQVYMEVHQAVIGRRGMRALFDAMSANNLHYDQHHSCGAILLFSRVDD
jgi:FkbM family methyltransferase